MKPFETPESSEYQAFLQSPEWAEVRDRVMQRDGYKCRICGCGEHLQAHHIRYQDDDGEQAWLNDGYIVTLCRPCHQIITEAVNEARSATVSTDVEVNAISFEKFVYGMKRQFYGVAKALIVKAMMSLYIRSLLDDAKGLDLGVQELRATGGILVDSIRHQSHLLDAIPYDHVSYVSDFWQSVSQYRADAYRYYASEGFDDETIRRYLRLNVAQLAKVKEHAKLKSYQGDGPDG